jgi:hypothetical protein
MYTNLTGGYIYLLFCLYKTIDKDIKIEINKSSISFFCLIPKNIIYLSFI